MKNKIVIGLGYGDEGKGKTVDWLCSQHPDSQVIRFSGGQQAGHTVAVGDDFHAFSHFGSGSFRGCPTIWKKYCTVDPSGFLNEYEHLIIAHKNKIKDLSLIVYFEDECPITTPYDIKHNQMSSEYRSNGTCGKGVGATWQREEDMYSLRYKDLKYPSVVEAKLNLIEYYYADHGISIEDREKETFLNDCRLLALVGARVDQYQYRSTSIYEGSQGLLLDQDIGFFPYVTRGNVSLKNLNGISLPASNPEIYLVTRAYTTRHGAGPVLPGLTTDDYPDDFNVTLGVENNEYNKFQKHFKAAPLSMELLRYAYDGLKESNPYLVNSSTVNLVVTCIDEVDKYYLYKQGEFHKYKTPQQLCRVIKSGLGIEGEIYMSRSPSNVMDRLKD